MSESPIELLKEEMESDEIYLRVNAIHRTKVIASLIGFDGIKNTLLPYFAELMKKEDDEVLFAIAIELGIDLRDFFYGSLNSFSSSRLLSEIMSYYCEFYSDLNDFGSGRCIPRHASINCLRLKTGILKV